MTGARPRFLLVVPALLAAGALSCREAPERARTPTPGIALARSPGGNIVRGCVSTYDPTVDYFPEKIAPEVAEQFTITYHRHYKVLTVIPRRDTTLRLTYTLVQCGTPVPPGLDPRRTFTIPIARAAVTHPDYFGMIDTLGLLDRVVAIGPAARVWTPRVRQAVAAGRIRDVGGQQHLDLETLLQLRPDVVFSYWSAVPEFNAPAKLDELGIHGVSMLGHWERHPLGGLEWLHVLASFANLEGRSDSIVRGIRRRYDSLRVAVASSPLVPVMHGVPQRDRWPLIRLDYAFHRLLQDARLAYLFAPLVDGAAFPQTSFESALPAARGGVLWLGGSSTWRTTADIVASDDRLAALPAVQRGAVYALDAHRDGDGRFPYPEQWLWRPDQYLADLIAVGHPELAPSHAFAFIRRIPLP